MTGKRVKCVAMWVEEFVENVQQPTSKKAYHSTFIRSRMEKKYSIARVCQKAETVVPKVEKVFKNPHQMLGIFFFGGGGVRVQGKGLKGKLRRDVHTNDRQIATNHFKAIGPVYPSQAATRVFDISNEGKLLRPSVQQITGEESSCRRGSLVLFYLSSVLCAQAVRRKIESSWPPSPYSGSYGFTPL